MSHRRLDLPLGATAAAVILALVTACSSSATTQQSSESTASSAPDAYGQCLSDHGVAVPAMPPTGPPPSGAMPPGGPPPGAGQGTLPPPPGVDQGTWEKALAACTSLAPTGMPGPPPTS